MKSFILLTALSISFLSCAQEGVKGNGNRITETRNVTANFNEVESAGAFEVVINNAPQDGKIKLEGDSNILEKIEVEVEGNTLVLKHKKNVGSFNYSGRILITFNAKNLKSIGLSGSGSITAKGTQEVDDFSAALSGSGDIEAKVSANHVNSGISGSGNITLSGKTNSFKTGISGSGDVKAFQLETKDADIAISGSGDVEITSNGSLYGAIAGSGDVHYKGNPSKINIKSGGSGDVIEEN